MSNMDSTKFFYKEKDFTVFKELDYLDTELVKINLNTVSVFVVSAPFVHRPDLVSYRLFGSYNYGWLIALHNDFLDPVMELTLGKNINVPDIDQYFRFYNRNSYSRPRTRI